MSPPAAAKPAYSLQKRLVLSFGIVLILFLGLAGLVLDQAFKGSVAAAVQERLQLQVYALLGVAEPENGGFFVPDLEEARFTQIDSGLYGFILAADGSELWRSPSALNLDLGDAAFRNAEPMPGETIFGSVDTAGSGPLSYAVYGIFWASQEQEYRFVVLESSAPSAAEIRQFQSSLWFWLGGLAVLLSLIQYLLLRWGLSPLQALAQDVAQVEAGVRDRLADHYPQELQALSNNMNLLIQSERERQSRYQTTLGDLAHSLKTPLAVIAGVVQDRPVKQVSEQDFEDIAEQVQRMNQIVSYQLKRAVKSGQNLLLIKPVKVEPLIQRVLNALQKVYQDRKLQVKLEMEPDAVFYGEESDLMELLGNLLDNAFKYTSTRVDVFVRELSDSLQISIEDDGPGIAPEQQRWVLERGARADTVKSGQGIGLAVVVDIVSSYGGHLEVGNAPTGGASISVTFPWPGGQKPDIRSG